MSKVGNKFGENSLDLYQENPVCYYSPQGIIIEGITSLKGHDLHLSNLILDIPGGGGGCSSETCLSANISLDFKLKPDSFHLKFLSAVVTPYLLK